MTNGEKLEQVFPDGICPFSKRGLDHEYKEPSTKINQDLTKNKSEIPTGSIIDWNNCHTSEQLANISTAKNDLGVDKTFYEQIMEYCNEHFLVLVEKDVWEDARKALTTKNNLAVDCIDRAELLKAMDTWDKFGYTETGCFVREPKGDYVPYVKYDDMVNCVMGMPPVTQLSSGTRKNSQKLENASPIIDWNNCHTSEQIDSIATTKNDLALICTNGLDEGIRCAMCTNSMKSDRGCDGSCVVNNAMYKEVMDVIENHIVDTDKMIEPTTKNDLGVDNQNIRLIDANALIKRLRPKHFDWWGEGEQDDFSKGNNSMLEEVIEAIEELPSVTPQEPRCKECKWWKDSDGEYRRGCGAESRCPINRREVFEGNGYCYLFEPQKSEDKE